MSYNIHPLFVHFPIALLFIYSILKIIPFKRWFPNVSWMHIERAFLLIGVLGALAADYTGSIAEHLTRPNRQLVEMHSTFAAISIWIYCALLLGEALMFLTPSIIPRLGLPWLTSSSLSIQKILTNAVVTGILALLGLMAISVTGLLGGVLVYGVSTDPVAGIVLKLLGLNI